MRIITFYIVILVLSICACKTRLDEYQITMTSSYLETNFPLQNGMKIVDFIPTKVREKHQEFLHVDDNNNFVFYKLKGLSREE